MTNHVSGKGGTLVSWGCHNKIPQIRWFISKINYFSQFWSLGIENQA